MLPKSVLEKYWSSSFFPAGLWTEPQARFMNLQKTNKQRKNKQTNKQTTTTKKQKQKQKENENNILQYGPNELVK